MCLRFRNEARYLREWLDYYLAAGVEHFYLYNNFSDDDFMEVLAPYVAAGSVSLIDWPHTPASPSAEEDCIARALGKFEWVGFLDADEFVVIGDGSSIPDFLEEFEGHPGVGLNWYYFGSNGQKLRPSLPVIQAYVRRGSDVNRHVKCFVRPAQVTQCKNSHSWYFAGGRCAVTEAGRKIRGSTTTPPHTAYRAWINHYYTKSEQDYREKAAVKSSLDSMGMKLNTRAATAADEAMQRNNDVVDERAAAYFQSRQRTIRSGTVCISDGTVGHNPSH